MVALTALVIPVYNRIGYLDRCFESLMKLTTFPGIIYLIDDASTDKEVKPMCDSFRDWCASKGVIVSYWVNEKNLGVKGTLQRGIEIAIRHEYTTIINLDSDAVVTPDFVERLVDLKKGFPNCIVSGFNHMSERNPITNTLVIEDGEMKPLKVSVKSFVNGINMCFSAEQYEGTIKPALQLEGNWDYNVSAYTPHRHIFTVPSCVQHIGMVSSMGHSGNGQVPDTAQDFPAEYMPDVEERAVASLINMLKLPKEAMAGFAFDENGDQVKLYEGAKPLYLPNVTLFGIDAHNKDGISRAAEISQRDIHFGAQKIITERLFPGATMQEGRQNYSKFIIKELYKHFDTSHVLIIHPDGYVQNWKAWKDEWLEYDLIGASWAYKDGKNVGNGGFSLRSKRLMQILATDPHIEDYHPEDCRIARQYRPYLEEKYGIKFAPEEVANQFSIEAYGSSVFKDSQNIWGHQYTGQFGFHGHHVRGLLIPM